MELNNIFEKFKSRMAQLHLTQEAVEDITNKAREKLRQESTSEDQEILSTYSYYYQLKPPAKDIYRIDKRQTVTVKERKEFLIIHKNKQHQWLLVEAYEEFEDFIENIYAYIGFKDKNLWRHNDFGNITIDEIKSKDYSWFQEKSKKKDTQEILNRLTEKFQDIKTINTSNAQDMNLKLVVTLIAHLRHIIVHKNGIVDDKDAFINKVLGKAGLSNNKNPKNVEFIESYLSQTNGIYLLKILLYSETTLKGKLIKYDSGRRKDMLHDLISYLWGYSSVITEAIENEFNEQTS